MQRALTVTRAQCDLVLGLKRQFRDRTPNSLRARELAVALSVCDYVQKMPACSTKLSLDHALLPMCKLGRETFDGFPICCPSHLNSPDAR
jgi:hypothetical protein